MLATEALADIELLIRSRYGLIHIHTVEEERTHSLLRHLSDRLTLPLFLWSRTRGLCRDGHANGVYETQEPAQALAHVVSSQTAALYHFPAGACRIRGAHRPHCPRRRPSSARPARSHG